VLQIIGELSRKFTVWRVVTLCIQNGGMLITFVTSCLSDPSRLLSQELSHKELLVTVDDVQLAEA